ncbi:hypothetical protein BU14_0121s0019 [Porphyra umbilicalis]|uniref:Uncharacterized protein n=1 Tax=Porphyra umbilicalis TaxID=2786 RepID=A0A1X6PB32_PORUM|nr:hypothetical protein BU14_0121s0019 [Porphyra umbilicalis]|eukprot:OSX78091.1 hypothetical protein BU14_0121s0019 [Porphyra umbilicalis]
MTPWSCGTPGHLALRFLQCGPARRRRCCLVLQTEEMGSCPYAPVTCRSSIAAVWREHPALSLCPAGQNNRTQATLPGVRNHAHHLALRCRCRRRVVVGRAERQPARTTRAIGLGIRSASRAVTPWSRSPTLSPPLLLCAGGSSCQRAPARLPLLLPPPVPLVLSPPPSPRRCDHGGAPGRHDARDQPPLPPRHGRRPADARRAAAARALRHRPYAPVHRCRGRPPRQRRRRQQHPTPRPRRSARLAALLRAVAAVAAAAVAIREASATERLWRERWGAGATADASDDAGVRAWVARKRAYQWVVAVKYAGDVLMSVGMLRAPVPGVVGGTGEALGGVVGSVVRCWQRWPRK